MQIRQMRVERGWSQEQLAERSGLSVRTIQRIEGGREPSLAASTSLAAALGVEVSALAVEETQAPSAASFVGSIRACLTKYADFTGRAGRPEYWWFFLAAGLVIGAGALVAEAVGAVVAIALAIPLLAAGTRRLRDAGHSGWWQLMALVPFGAVVPLIMLALPSQAGES